MWSRRRICCLVCSPFCFVLSCFSLAGALLLYFLLPSFLTSYVNQELVISPGHATYKQLKDPILPLYNDIYFFNLTNPGAFSEGKAAPDLKEVGPYSYREIRRKFFNESSFSKDKTRLTYTQLKTLHFSAETSGHGLKEDDTICTINFAMVAVMAEVLKLDNIVEREAAILFARGIFWKTKAKLYICQPATALVFNYTDPLIHELHVNKVLKIAKMNFKTNYVSLQLNASKDDAKPSIIDTGYANINNIGQFYQWDGKRRLDIWYDDYANMINGTEGMLFKPHLQEGEDVVAFVDDAYRSIPLGYIGKAKIKGLHTFKYGLPKRVFESAFNNPSNARWGSWCPDGLFYLGAIQKPGAPVFASKPRFLDAAPEETTRKIKLLPPDREKHDTYAYIEPMLGLTLQFQRSLQFNLQVNHSKSFPELKHFNGTMYFPVFYVKEHAELTDHVKRYINDQGLLEYNIAKYLRIVVFALLLFISFVALLCTVFTGYRSTKRTKRENYVAIND